MKRISNLVQFIIGFILGLAILAGGTAAVAYVFFAKMNANPPKPTFAEEKKKKRLQPSKRLQPPKQLPSLPLRQNPKSHQKTYRLVHTKRE